MPNYDLRCTNEKCKQHDKIIETLCSMIERENQVCKECGGKLTITHIARKNGVKGFNIKGEHWTSTSGGRDAHNIHD